MEILWGVTIARCHFWNLTRKIRKAQLARSWLQVKDLRKRRARIMDKAFAGTGQTPSDALAKMRIVR